MTRLVFSLALILATSGTALCADTISWVKNTSGKRTVEVLDGVTITAWNARNISYSKDNRPATVDSGSVLQVVRVGGTMSTELDKAIGNAALDPATAAEVLQPLTTRGSDLDKEEALYRLAEFAGMAARGQRGQAATEAARRYNDYITRYKAGFFAREAYVELSEILLDANRASDARTALRNMISADSALARLGNQKLGELEYSMSKPDMKAAIAAFKAAENASGEDRLARYLAQAWQGAAMVADGQGNAAREMLERITGDEAFQEDTSDEDEIALGVAWPALADIYFAAGTLEKAFDAYLSAAYLAWWNRAGNEGYALRQACICAKKLQGTDEKWKSHMEKLRTALAVGFPRELAEVDKAK